jgi:hypothetical protein
MHPGATCRGKVSKHYVTNAAIVHLISTEKAASIENVYCLSHRRHPEVQCVVSLVMCPEESFISLFRNKLLQ